MGMDVQAESAWKKGSKLFLLYIGNKECCYQGWCGDNDKCKCMLKWSDKITEAFFLSARVDFRYRQQFDFPALNVNNKWVCKSEEIQGGVSVE